MACAIKSPVRNDNISTFFLQLISRTGSEQIWMSFMPSPYSTLVLTQFIFIFHLQQISENLMVSHQAGFQAFYTSVFSLNSTQRNISCLDFNWAPSSSVLSAKVLIDLLLKTSGLTDILKFSLPQSLSKLQTIDQLDPLYICSTRTTKSLQVTQDQVCGLPHVLRRYWLILCEIRRCMRGVWHERNAKVLMKLHALLYYALSYTAQTW